MKIGNKFKMLLGLLLALSLCACAGQPIKNSGFLGNEEAYAKIKVPGRAVDKVWIDPAADFKKYKKIMLDEVVFYLKKDGESQAVHPEDIKELTDAFHKAFVEKLGKDYPLVSTPGPDVLRVRVAIVDIESSNRALDTITTVLPVGIAVSLVKSGAGGGGTGVGRASMEFELIDSQTNQVLAMGKDTEIGSKLNMEAKVDEWGHAKAAFAHWAESLKKALDDISAGTFTLEKKEG
jgi:hypothetical protein